jgi:hypothetical protein
MSMPHVLTQAVRRFVRAAPILFALALFAPMTGCYATVRPHGYYDSGYYVGGGYRGPDRYYYPRARYRSYRAPDYYRGHGHHHHHHREHRHYRDRRW